MRIQFVRSFHRTCARLNYSNIKLTFFSKPSCPLCQEAKEVLDDVLDSEEFKKYSLAKRLEIVDINKNQKWGDAYCFDIPVLHVEDANGAKPLVKVMHFFKEDELGEILRRFK